MCLGTQLSGRVSALGSGAEGQGDLTIPSSSSHWQELWESALMLCLAQSAPDVRGGPLLSRRGEGGFGEQWGSTRRAGRLGQGKGRLGGQGWPSAEPREWPERSTARIWALPGMCLALKEKHKAQHRGCHGEMGSNKHYCHMHRSPSGDHCR